MKYKNSLKWLLEELSLAETEQFETGVMEIIGEDEQGREGSCEVEIADLASAAKNRIEELEKAIEETIGFIESANTLKEEDGEESLRALRNALSTN